MVFSSLLFLFYFLPAVLAVYFIVPRRAKNVVLLLFSLFFYAWGEPVYIFLMLFSICMDYLLGLWMERAKQAPGRAKKVLALAVVLNVALLGFFKYADFFVENLNALTGLAIPALQIPLPIGISFYTFQAMSYLIDLYRGDVPVQRNIISFGTYVSLFPQLIAGPIVRMRTVVGGPWQKGAHRQYGRRGLEPDFRDGYSGTSGFNRMDWLIRLYVPDLFRFFRLFGYGDRPGADVWLSLP